MEYKLSRHAKKRWNERCGDLDIKEEMAWLKLPTRSQKKVIRKSCPAHSKFISRIFKGQYELISKNKVVFVMSGDHVVKTVFKLIKEQNDDE